MKVSWTPSRPKDYYLTCKYTEEVIYFTSPWKYLNRESNTWFIVYLYHVNPFLGKSLWNSQIPTFNGRCFHVPKERSQLIAALVTMEPKAMFLWAWSWVFVVFPLLARRELSSLYKVIILFIYLEEYKQPRLLRAPSQTTLTWFSISLAHIFYYSISQALWTKSFLFNLYSI